MEEWLSFVFGMVLCFLFYGLWLVDWVVVCCVLGLDFVWLIGLVMFGGIGLM